MPQEYLHVELTQRILRGFYNVYNKLGYGFLEKIYENALKLELEEMGLKCDQQRVIDVFYKGRRMGEYYADLIVNGLVILELKAMESLCVEHEYQLVNYLRATRTEIGLLLNFGKKPQAKRKIFTNDFKKLSV